jgi:predicted metal-dependent hydrolase
MSMTDLQVRRIPFRFDDDVPFAWHPTNPEFGITMNAVSLFIIGFEKYIVDAVRQAMPGITDPAVAEEADAFLRQEAIHARVHRLHIKALSSRYPGLKSTLDEVVNDYARLFDEKPLEFHLAYIADLEATFTPYFKMLLDHEDEFFRPGDEQVASFLLWHFTEEIEHRSSGLTIYDHVVGDPWYRLRQLPAVVRHIARVVKVAIDGFNEHVPFEDRLVDARCIMPDRQLRRQFAGQLPFLAKGLDIGYPTAMEPVPADEQRRAYQRVLGSQRPGHDPTGQPLPDFATTWFERYERGDDVTRWYSSQQAG